MSAPTIQQLHATWIRRTVGTFRGRALSMATIDLLADGAPVTPAGLAAATGRTVAQVEAYIESARQAGAELVDGATVGRLFARELARSGGTAHR